MLALGRSETPCIRFSIEFSSPFLIVLDLKSTYTFPSKFFRMLWLVTNLLRCFSCFILWGKQGIFYFTEVLHNVQHNLFKLCSNKNSINNTTSASKTTLTYIASLNKTKTTKKRHKSIVFLHRYRTTSLNL